MVVKEALPRWWFKEIVIYICDKTVR
jgi:hypothetical protein